jgi:hypothetical protein
MIKAFSRKTYDRSSCALGLLIREIVRSLTGRLYHAITPLLEADALMTSIVQRAFNSTHHPAMAVR